MICSHAEKNMLTQISQITQNYSYAECFVSRKSRQSHEGCVASLAAVGFVECLHGTIRECNDETKTAMQENFAFFARFA